MAERTGNKLFFVDENGCKGDAELLEPILAAGDHEAARQAVIECARAMKLTDEQIAVLYPDPGSLKGR